MVFPNPQLPKSMSEQYPTISATGFHFEEEIAALAYRYFEEEGRPEGKAHEHWLRAEREFRESHPDEAGSDADSRTEEAMHLGQ